MRWPRRRRNGKQPLRAPASASGRIRGSARRTYRACSAVPDGASVDSPILPRYSRSTSATAPAFRTARRARSSKSRSAWDDGGRPPSVPLRSSTSCTRSKRPGSRRAALLPCPTVGGGSHATLPDGRALVFLGAKKQRVVLEMTGIDTSEQATLARTVASRLEADLIVRSPAASHQTGATRDERVVRGDPVPNRPEGRHERQMTGVAQHRIRHEAACTRCATAGRGIAHLALQVAIEVFEPVRVVEHGQEPRRPREVGALDRHSVEPAVGATNERAHRLLRRARHSVRATAAGVGPTVWSSP